MQHSRGKAALVFCSTRKGAQEAALHLSQTVKNFGFSNPFVKSMDQLERLQSSSLLSSDKQMQACIQCGVGYHNGGLCLNDRNLVEGLFLKGDLQVLCTTNTLAHGINLPAHTVIIKSTQYFNKEKGRYLEYDRSTILQMCGRAGRPQFDDSGLVIIMTRKETLHLYENLLSGCEMVESKLLSSITEHLNAEIVQLTVSDISLAIEWLKCSFLYVRIKQNPEHYGVKKGITSEQLEKRLKEICVQNVNELAQYEMILTDEYGFTLKPLEPGRLMAKYYLRCNTMKEIMKTPKKCSMEDLLHIISQSEEIAWIQLRRSEKKLLNDINCDKNGRLRFHILETNGKIKKRIQTREEKIFVLANDGLSGDSVIHEMTLNQDVNAICSNGSRIARCMKECFIFQKKYTESINSMVLAKCLHQKLWDDSPYQLKQLVGVGMVTAKALYLSGISSFENLEKADPRRLEIITSRKYPFGNHIKDSLLCLPPKIDIKIEGIDFKRQGKIKLIVTLTRLSTSSPSSKRHFADLLIGSEEDNLILFHERISNRLDEFSSPYTVRVYISSVQETSTNIKIDLISEEYVGVDLHEKFISSKKENAKKHRHKAVEELGALEIQPPTRFCDRQKKEEKLNLEPLSSDVCSTDTENQDVCSMPTFNLLLEDKNTDDHEDNEKGKKAKISGERILQHIRRKARKLPSFETSLPCNSPNLHAVQLLPSRISNKNKRLESENQHAADLTPHVKRTKDDGTCGSSLDTIKTSSADLLVCDLGRTRDLKFQEANITNIFSPPNFLIKGHNVASAETMDSPQNLSSIKPNANLDKNFPPDCSSVITIEDSKTSGSSSPADGIEISRDINYLHSLNGAKSEISSGHNSLAFSFVYEDVKNKSVKLQSESIESSTRVSSTKSSPKHIVTSAKSQIHGMLQQQHPIADRFHRASGTLTESQDLSISFLAEENGGSSFLGCQSVFSFL